MTKEQQDQATADTIRAAWGFKQPSASVREALRAAEQAPNPYVVELERLEKGFHLATPVRGSEAVGLIPDTARAQIEEALTARGWLVTPANVIWVHDVVWLTEKSEADAREKARIAAVQPFGNFNKTALPAATGRPGKIIFVNDATGGAQLAFSDGTTWRRIADRTVIS
jgi:hypothetical protein